MPHQLTDPLQYIFRRAFRVPLQFGYGLPSLAAPKAESIHVDPAFQAELERAQQENRELKNHLATLEAELAERAERIKTLSHIRQQSGWDRMTLVPADTVMSLGPGHLVINRGLRDGLQKGLYAIVDNAIVGRLVQVGTFESELMLITHPKCVMEALILWDRGDTQERQPIVGKLDGTGDGRMRMRINGRSDVRVGDPVHIRRHRFLDIPVIVGRISDYAEAKDEPLLLEVLVDPVTPLTNVQGVCVLCFAGEG